MDPISVTLSQGGRPFLTTRLRSVVFQDAGRVQGGDRVASANAPETKAAQSQRNGDGQGPEFSLKRADGFGEEALRNLFLSRTGDAPANSDTALRTTAGADQAAQSADGLTDAEREQVEKLKARDAEVRRHEQAHAAVGGQYASAPSYTFQQGPDGRRYAIGGEVQIDVAAVPGDPEATIDKMGVVKAAALAPAEPSAADRRVAALADAQRLQAMAELATLRTEERLEVFTESNVANDTARDASGTGDFSPLPDTRFANAAGLLALGDDAQPGQKLNTAA